MSRGGNECPLIRCLAPVSRLNIGGYRDQIANFSTSGQNLINVEVMSYTNASGETANADHYIYFGNTRDYSEIAAAGERAAQMDFDGKVNDFMTQLILASQTRTALDEFINVNADFLEPSGSGSYKYYPYGKPI